MSKPQMKNGAKKNKNKKAALRPLISAIRNVFKAKPALSPKPKEKKAERPTAPPKSIRFESIEPRVLMAADTAIAISGSIDTPGEIDQYGFTLTSDVKVVFDSLTNNANLNWSLSGPNGAVVSGRNFTSSDSASMSGSPAMSLAAGDYTITVDATRDATGAYGFRLIELQTAPEIIPGTAVSGQLSPAAETDAYKFNVTAGEKFYFDVGTMSGPQTYWRLLDPNGQLVFGPTYMSGGTDIDVMTLGVTGNYTLLIEGYYTNTGVANYNFNVQKVTDDVAPLEIGTAVSGTIAHAGQVDRYTFSLENTANLYFDSLTSDSNFAWTLVGPLGTVVSRNFTSSDSGNLGGSTLLGLIAGNYTLYIDPSNNTTGAYGFRLLDIQSATELTPGTVASGQLNPGNETDLFKFNVTAGDRFYFDMRNVTSGTTYWRLVDPFGRLVFGPNHMNGGDVDVLTLGYSGTYTLFVEGMVGVISPTNYAFNVQKVQDDDTETLVIGDTTNGEITTAGQMDRYRFSLDQPAQLYFDALSSVANMFWTLVGPRGTVVSGRNFGSSDSGNLSGSPVFDLVAGEYTLLVDASSDATGAYSFRFLDITGGTTIVPGTVVTAQLAPGAETDIFRFEANYGDQFFFDHLTASGGTTYWRLLDPFNRLVFGPSGFSDMATQTLNFAGTYTLLVEGYISNGAPIDYSFNIDPRGNVPVAPLPLGTAMTLNTTVSGSLATSSERDNFTFSVADGAQLYIDGLVTDSRFQWTLAGPRGTIVSSRQLITSDSAWGDSSALLELAAGDYVLTIHGTGVTGGYSFRMMDKAVATSIVPGTTVSGTLTPSNETDAYKFNVTAGERYFFDVHTLSTTTYWRLLDPYGRLAFGPSHVGDIDVTTLSYNGVYTLLVEGPYNLTGTTSYSFNVQKVVDDVATMSIGTTVNGAIAHVGQQDRYTFTLTDSMQVYMDAMVNSSNFNWSLIGPRGAVVSGRSLYTSDSAWLSGNPMLDLVAGDYTLIVDGNGEGAGSYAFRLLNKATAASVVPGTLVSGQLSPGQETDAYKFDAVAGDRFYFDVQTVSTTCYWRMLDPNGQVVFGPTQVGDIDVFTLTASGTYTLLVEGPYYISSAINYSFNLQKVTDDSTALTIGATVNGSIAHVGQNDRYTFTLENPAQLYMDAMVNSSNFYWSLFGPNGVVISGRALYNSDSAWLSGHGLYNLVAGDYTLIVDGSGEQTGAYAFRLLDKAAATPMPVNTMVSGTLNPGQETEIYKFDAAAGDRFFFELQSLSNTCYWRLLDPKGQLVWGPNQMGDIEPFAVGLTGSYTLLVEGPYYIPSPISYSFRVQKVIDDVTAIELGVSYGAGSKWTDGQLGGALHTDDSHYGEVANSTSLNLTGSMTVEMWFKVDQFNSGWMPLVYKGNNTNDGLYSLWIHSNGYLYLSNGNGSNQFVQTANNVVRLGEWMHVAGVVDRTTGQMLIYLNGELAASGAARTTAAPSNTNPLYFGYALENGATYHFNGEIDDLRLWNTARTLEQVRANKDTELVGDEADLNLYMKFNEGAGAAAADTTGKNAAAVLKNLFDTASGVIVGSIAHAGQQDRYTFTLDNPAQLYMDAMVNSSNFTWSLIGPRGAVISGRQLYTSDSAWLGGNPFLDLAAGDYTLIIDGNNKLTGSYAFRLLDRSNATTVVPGTPVTGLLNPGQETHTYKFDATAGERFYLDLTSVSNTCYWRLIDPYGQLLFGPSNMGDIEVFTTAHTGTYTLLVEGPYYLPQAISYSFNVQKVTDQVKALEIGVSQGVLPTWTSGVLDGAVSLDYSRYAEVPNTASINLTQSTTMEMWFQVEHFESDWMPLVYKGNGNSGERTYSLWISKAGFVHLSTGDGTNQTVSTAVGSIVAGQWYHFAGVLDRVTGQMSIYLDGVQAASGALRTTAARTNTNPLMIGANSESGSRFHGVIDDFRLWDTARTQAEIQSNKDAELVGNEAGLKLYFKLNEESGTTLLDATGNNTGELKDLYGSSSGVVAGTLAHAGQQHRYTFTLAEAKQLYFDSLTNVSTLNWSLIGPLGTVISGRSFTNSDSVNFGGTPALDLAAGNYTLVIDGGGDATGRYAFRLMDLSAATQLTLGATVTGTLSPAIETDVYTFDVVAGERFYFDLQSSTGGQPYWRLLDPYGRLVFGPNHMPNGDVDVLALGYSGTYTLLIEGYIHTTGVTNYSFAVKKVVDEAVVAITVGETVFGALAVAGQLDRYRFSLSQASQLYFDSLTNSSSFNWSLTGPRGTVISSRNFTTSDAGSLSGTPLIDLVAGDYELVVDGSVDAIGAYSFQLLDLAAATDIVAGDTISGQLAPAKETNAYRFTVNAGDQFYFDQLSISGGSPFWRLLDPYGRLVFGPNTFLDVPVQTLNYAGVYTLLVEGRVTDTGATVNYSFKVDPRGNIPVAPLPTGTAMTVGVAVAGALSIAGEKDNYSFTLAGPAALYFDVLTNNTAIRWSLTGPRGTVVSNRSFGASDSGHIGGNPVLDLVEGNYVLTIDGTSTGDYTFRVMDIATATALVPGTAVTGQLNPGNESELYKFDVTAGERFYFDMQTGNNGHLYWRLIDPYGRVAFDTRTMNDIDVITLGTTGTYTLMVEGLYQAPSAMAYTFNVQKVVDDTATLAIGTTISGTIAHAGQVDRYTFSLTDPAQFLFDVLSNSGSLSWGLIGPRGTVVSRNFTASDSGHIGGNPTLDLLAGDYTLYIDSSADTTGAYSFRLLNLVSATVLVPNTPVTGQLNPGNESELYKFNVTAGERFYFDMQAGNNGQLYWRLVDPYGRVAFDTRTMNDIDVITLGTTGAYTLMVEGLYQATSPMAYTFNVQKVTDDVAALTIGAATSGTISHAGQADRFTFSLTESSNLYFDVLSNTTNNYWTLVGPRGTVVGGRNFGSSDSGHLGGNPSFIVPAGDYTLYIDAGAEGTGAYSFRLLNVGAATAITPGTAVVGQLNPGNETELYKFDATAGDRFYFDMQTATNSYLYWRLVDPYGRVAFDTRTMDDVDVMTLGTTGTYILMVEGLYQAPGPVNYGYNVTPSPLSQKVMISGLGELPGPDLVVRNVSVTSLDTEIHSGGQVTISWDVENLGNESTSGSWQERVLVRNVGRNEIIGSLIVSYDATADGAIEPGAQRHRQAVFTLPEGNRGAGNLSFQVVTDITNTVTERGANGSGESNNSSTTSVTSTLTLYPDLQASGLTVSPAGSWVPGVPVTMQWRVTNTGGAPVTGVWSDRVLVRNLTTNQSFFTTTLAYAAATEGPIAAGAFVDRQVSFNWPSGLASIGRFEFSVVTDSASQVFENNAADTGEANNAVTLIATSAPDLVVSNLRTTPDSTEAGGTVTIQWDDVNGGDAPTPAGWFDRVVIRNITTGEQLVNDAVYYDPSQTGNGVLAPGQSRARAYTYRLPEGLRGTGQLQITVTVDQTSSGVSSLFEFNQGGTGESNNASSTNIVSQAKPYADLSVVSVVAPETASSGSNVDVTWEVTNHGLVSTSAAWVDRVILSQDNVVGNADDVVLATITRNGALAVGAGYITTASVKIPTRLEGAYRIAVVTDALSAVLEPDTRADNARVSSPITIAATNADLIPEITLVPAEANAGRLTRVEWSVRNQGTIATDVNLWVDQVYLSTTPTMDNNAVLVGSLTHVGFLASGGGYSTGLDVTLPRTVGGQMYFIVKTNVFGNVYERASTANNAVVAATPTQILAEPKANLQVIDLVAPAVWKAGDTLSLTYTVQNIGNEIASTWLAEKIRLVDTQNPSNVLELKTVSQSRTVNPGTAYTQTVSVDVPVIGTGNWRLEVIADALKFVDEQNELDNTTSQIVSIVHPDVVVNGVTISGIRQGGETVGINWTTNNIGSADAANVRESVYLSRNGVLDASDIKLGEFTHSMIAAGGSGAASISALLPVDSQGSYQLLVVTDVNALLKETVSGEANNLTATSVDIAQDFYADLRVSNILAPTSVIDDPATVNVEWTVTNQGTGVGRNTAWTDLIVFSTDMVVGNVDDVVMGQVRHDGALQAGESYSGSLTYTFGPAFSGRGHVFVRTDKLSEVWENGNEANNTAEAASTLDVMPIPYADLQVESVTTQGDAASGKPLRVTWSVVNNGVGITNTGGWSDSIWLSTNPNGTGVVATFASANHLGQLAVGDRYSRTLDVTLPDGIEGTYYLNVGTGGPFEFTYTTNNRGTSMAVPVTLSLSPDLVVETIDVQDQAQEGALINLNWTVLNQGLAKAGGLWTDTVTLIPASGIGPSYNVGSFTYDRGLEPGIRYTREEQVRLPSKIEGLYRIRIVTNSNFGVYEYGVARNNNTLTGGDTVEVSLNARPDLRITNMIVPEHVTAGTNAAIRFTVSNQGPTATSGRWTDRIYLSLDGTYSGDDVLVGSFENGAALAPTESYSTESAAVKIPVRFRGNAYLIVVADANNNIDEYPNETNNIRAAQFYVDPIPFADLVTSDVVAPDQAVHGSSIEVNYKVANKGSDTTMGDSASVTSWTDTIWLSRDKTRPAGYKGDILIGSVTHQGHLTVGQDYLGTAQVTIPDGVLSGQYFITVWSDTYDAILEDSLASNVNTDDPYQFDSSNYKARAIGILGITPPDLTITELSALTEADAPGNYSFTYTVQNRGDLFTGKWTDKVYITNNPDLKLATERWDIGTYEQDRTMANGEKYTISQILALAPSVKGRYLVVQTDAHPLVSIKELDETNNIRAQESIVSVKPADLQVTSIVTEPENFSGEETTVTFTVTNNGATVWPGTQGWVDSIYFSPDPVFIPTRATALGAVVHSNTGGLAAGASYTATAKVKLPPGTDGNYYIYVITDSAHSPDALTDSPSYSAQRELRTADNRNDYARDVFYKTTVYENLFNDNNIGRGTLNVTYREPDLQVDTITVSNPNPSSGQPLTVTWTVTNRGTRDTRANAWWDGVFLSRDGGIL